MLSSFSRPPRPRAPAGEPRANVSGYTLMELIVLLSLLGFVLSLSVPSLWRLSARLRLELACAEVVSTLRLTQSHAVRWSDNGQRLAAAAESCP